MEMSRREVLAGGASVTGAIAAGSLLPASDARANEPNSSALPNPSTSGIDHIVVVCMENRSFDHLLGWLPGADGQQAGLSYRDAGGTAHPTHHLTTTQGCAWADPDHSYSGGRTEYNGGACDGWLLANDVFSIGYYQAGDLPFLGNAAPVWTVCDRFFASTMGPTFPNRLYLLGRADRPDVQHVHLHVGADDLRPPRGRRGFAPLLLLGRPVLGPMGTEVPRREQEPRHVLRRRRQRPAAGGELCRAGAVP